MRRSAGTSAVGRTGTFGNLRILDVPTRLLISEYGTRIAIRATLAAKYAFTPDDGQAMALTFELFNSVDGSVPLMAAVGWFRFVCSNGLVVGTTSAKVRQRHSSALNIHEISGGAAALQRGEPRGHQSIACARSASSADVSSSRETSFSRTDESMQATLPIRFVRAVLRHCQRFTLLDAIHVNRKVLPQLPDAPPSSCVQ